MMYLSHFGLRTRPFRTTPDVDGYYPATTHENALAELRRGLEDEEGLMLLRGEPGTGKTLVAYLLIEGMPKGTRTVYLTHGSFQTRAELLQAVLFDLGLPYQEMSDQELRLCLMESCLDHFRECGRTVVIVDEAHSLPAMLLEELRLLGNLEGQDGKAVQVVLVGLPRIADVLEQPGLDAFRQRLSVCARLEPLSIEESADYLFHQVRRSGGRPESLFGEDVIDILSHACRGIPRFLNQAAHLAFVMATEGGSSNVDAEAAVEAVSRLGLDDAPEERPADEEPVHEAIEPPHESEAAPMPPAAARPMSAAQQDGPPIFVYGGGIASPADRPIEALGPRVWHMPPTRAG